MKFDFTFIKKHPYGSGAAILLGGLLLWYFFLRGSSAPAAAASNAPIDESNTPAGLQGQQIAGQIAAMQESDQTQIALATLSAQIKGQEDADTFSLGQGQLQLQGQQLQSQQTIALAQLNTQLQEQEAGYAASITQQHDAIQGTIAQATINANLQQNLAAVTAQTETNLAQFQSQDFQAQLQSQQIINGQNVELGEAQISGQSSSQMWGTIGTIAALALL